MDYTNTSPDIVDVTAPSELVRIAISSAQYAEINMDTGQVSLGPVTDASKPSIIVPQPTAALPDDAEIVYVSSSIERVPVPGPLATIPTPGPLATVPPSVGALEGLLNKKTGMVARILGKLGKAGKLLGPLAAIAAALLAAIGAYQALKGSPEKDKAKGGAFNDGTDGPLSGAGAGGAVAGGVASAGVLTALESGNLPNVFIAIECGEFSSIANCLCDESIRAAVLTLERQFNTQERQLIIRKLCGCGLKKPTVVAPVPQPTIGPAPVITMPPNVVPVINTAPQPSSTPTTPSCYADLPPVGTYPRS